MKSTALQTTSYCSTDLGFYEIPEKLQPNIKTHDPRPRWKKLLNVGSPIMEPKPLPCNAIFWKWLESQDEITRRHMGINT